MVVGQLYVVGLPSAKTWLCKGRGDRHLATQEDAIELFPSQRTAQRAADKHHPGLVVMTLAEAQAFWT